MRAHVGWLSMLLLVAGSAAPAQTAPATAEPTVLRMAAIAPEGTSWARELKAFARNVEKATDGALRIKWYLGGVAGDESEELDRIKRDQLDGGAGAMICDILAPSLSVTSIAGLLHSRAEASRVVNLLTPTIAEEFQRNGFVFLGAAGFGLDVVFSRTPMRSLADLRRGRFWIRKYDDVLRATLTVRAAAGGAPRVGGAGGALRGRRARARSSTARRDLSFARVDARRAVGGFSARARGGAARGARQARCEAGQPRARDEDRACAGAEVSGTGMASE
jgi:hypothetical protein